MRKICFIVFLSFILSQKISLLAQQSMDMIPPSPTSSQFEKYIDYPTDLSHGLPVINIPLCPR